MFIESDSFSAEQPTNDRIHITVVLLSTITMIRESVDSLCRDATDTHIA